MKRLSLLSAISIALAGCGSDSSSNPTPPADTTFAITSSAITTATEDIAYRYQLTTNHQGNVTYQGLNLPAGMQLSSDGLLSWTPLEGVLTSNEVTITAVADNEDADTDSQVFTISVTPVNDQLVIAPISNMSVDSGETLSYQIQVTDPDDLNNGTDIQFTLTQMPNGLTVSDTGLLTLNSSATASVDSPVTIRIQDGLEDNTQPVVASFTLSELFYLNVSGTVSNYYSNDMINASDVTISNNGQIAAQTTTDAQGVYSAKILDRAIDPALPIIVSADAVGFTEASESKSISEISSDINLYLPAVHAQVEFNSQVRSELQVDNETIVTIEPGSFVNEQGETVTGDITSELFVIDPTLDIDLMPGEMITDDGQGGTTPIESFGAISATFTDSNGNDLQLASGAKAEIRIPASGNNPPPTIPLYYYDEVQGVWVEEGVATLQNGFYVGEVEHFTTWNADRVYETINIKGCVVDPENTPIANARIQSEGIDYNGRSSAYSDEEGNFTIPVRMDSTVLISAVSNYQSRTETIRTQADDYVMTECLGLDEAITKIQLTWGADPRDLDSHFYGPNNEGGRFHVYYSNESVLIGTDTIFLDVDDTSSYGPEVITVPDFTVPGTYRYAIHKFSGTGDMKRNQTKVELTIDNDRMAFIPPEGTPQRWWHVFEIEVFDDLSTTVNIINQWSNTGPDTAAAVERQAITPSSQSIAEKLLKQKYYAD